MACNGLPFVASCKTAGSCGDYYGAGYTKVSLMAGCGAAYSETPCDAAGSVGSCERKVSGNQCGEAWYYPPLTASVAMDNCKGTKDTWYPAP